MKNKYKILEYQESGIICDNIKCDYESSEKVITHKEMSSWVNKPCPKCGDNLLTMKDYNHHKKLIRIVNIINYICFPFMFLIGGKNNKNCSSISYHHHDGKTTIERHE